jgi:protein transport protein SEC61 subunit gamma and related proteins
MDKQRKPTPFPPPVEDDEEEETPKSTLPDAVVEREAQKAIEEIDEEIEEEHPSRPSRAPPVHHEGPQRTFVDKAWDAQYRVENRFKRIGHGRYGRVVKMARKPEPEEFAKASQITGLGILIVGFIGFLILLLVAWIMGLLDVK